MVRDFELLRKFLMWRNNTAAAITTTTNRNNNVAGMNALDFGERPVGVAKK